MTRCPHCPHDLRRHQAQRPVYDKQMLFGCSSGCVVDGTTAQVEAAKDPS